MRRLFGLSLVLLMALCPQSTTGHQGDPLTPELKREGIRWPGEGGQRIKVSIGLYLVDFARINLREESFDMAGYLDTSWIDPSLALKGPEARGRFRRFRPGNLWTPELEFVNAVEQVTTERVGDLYVTDEGQVSQRVRFSHKFQSPLDLKRFPFDSQTLSIVVSPFDPFARDLDLVKDQKRVGQLDGASVTDWEIGKVEARVLEGSGEDPTDRFVFEVKVARRSTFYIWRILLPMTLLVITSWIVFWFEPLNLQPQVSTCLAILLSLVTFTYAIDFSLPKVAYLTFIDRFTLTSFAFVLTAIFVVSVIHVFGRSKGAEVATKIQHAARFVMPTGFLLAVSGIAWFSFR